MKKTWVMLLLAGLPALLFPDIRNRDKPLNGEWNFHLEKVWEVDKAGGEVFGLPFTLTVAEDDRVYIFDPKNEKNYILDKDGALISTFGRSGQGPGELIGQERTFFIDGRLAIIDGVGIKYFSREGNYLKTSGLETLRRSPQIILGEDEFISFPMTAIGAPEGKGEVYYSKLDGAVERKIGEFSMTQAGIGSVGENVMDIIVIGLSPLLVAGYDHGRLYWGASHSYEIHISDLEGRTLGGFSVNRKARSVSNSFKKQFFKGPNVPPEMAAAIAKSFSNRLTYFHRIEVHDGLVYVFVPELDLDQGKARTAQIDIFSLEGRYLYRARLDFGKGLTHLFSPLSNLCFRNGYLYAVCSRADDTVVLVKYKADLPKGEMRLFQ